MQICANPAGGLAIGQIAIPIPDSNWSGFSQTKRRALLIGKSSPTVWELVHGHGFSKRARGVPGNPCYTHTHTLFGTPCQSVRNYLALPFNGAHDHMTPVPRPQLINKLTTRYTERKKCYTLLVQAQESN